MTRHIKTTMPMIDPEGKMTMMGRLRVQGAMQQIRRLGYAELDGHRIGPNTMLSMRGERPGNERRQSVLDWSKEA